MVGFLGYNPQGRMKSLNHFMEGVVKDWLKNIWLRCWKKIKYFFVENIELHYPDVTYPDELLQNRIPLGPASERIARFYLEQKYGYTCIGQNVKIHMGENHGRITGEIDLIMQDPTNLKTIIFVEVRSRSKLWSQYKSPFQSVNETKKNRIRIAAKNWLRRSSFPIDHPVRFDIVGIIWPQDSIPDVHYYPDAFQFHTTRNIRVRTFRLF